MRESYVKISAYQWHDLQSKSIYDVLQRHGRTKDGKLAPRLSTNFLTKLKIPKSIFQKVSKHT